MPNNSVPNSLSALKFSGCLRRMSMKACLASSGRSSALRSTARSISRSMAWLPPPTPSPTPPSRAPCRRRGDQPDAASGVCQERSAAGWLKGRCPCMVRQELTDQELTTQSLPASSCARQVARAPKGPQALHRVLGRFHRACPDDLAGRLGLEHHRLAGERIGALARLGGGLLDDHEFGKAGNQEHSGFLQLLVADGGEGFQNALDILL